MPDCLFCQIANKEIPAEVVYEGDEVLAFEDIDPQAPVHILIIPKAHIPTIQDEKAGSGNLLASLYEAVQKIASDKGLDDQGYRVVVNHGEQGGQSVAHLHFHLLGGRNLTWPPG